jgi:hypothetical protein
MRALHGNVVREVKASPAGFDVAVFRHESRDSNRHNLARGSTSREVGRYV